MGFDLMRTGSGDHSCIFWHDDSIVAIMGLLACLLAPEPLVGKDNLFFIIIIYLGADGDSQILMTILCTNTDYHLET